MTTNKRGVAYQLWDFFCSLRLTIFLLIGLALTSIIGTVIQQGPQREYLATLSETKIRIYSALGFFDMYHSWWFILLLYLLTLNLICCSIKRLPRVWKFVSEPVLVMDERFQTSLTNVAELKLRGSKGELKERVASVLAANFGPATVTEQDGEIHLFAQKNAWSRLGVYVVHFSIIIVFIGALIGSFFGYKAYVSIPEGAAVNQVESRSGKTVDLGFAVRCEKFTVSFYDTGAPKEFKSILTVLDKNGQPVPGRQNIPVIVNEPLTFNGVTFYQSSYGQSDEGSLYHVSVRNRNGGAPVKLTARPGERIALPGGAFLSVMEATQDVHPFMREFDGPGAQVEFTPAGGQPQPFVILSDKYKSFNAQHGGDLIINFDGMDQKFYTGLQVAKDPGVWVVWLGCFMMVVGTCMAFFMSHKRVWARVSDDGVTVGGSANKNPTGFELFFEDLVQKLNKA